jgi:hypothetical protein
MSRSGSELLPLSEQTESWERLSAAVARVLQTA